MGTGNPFSHSTPAASVPVYPRGHGESVPAVSGRQVVRGLSPWARGIRWEVRPRSRYLGSIPVGTGNPTGSGSTSVVSAVYPRGHGESLRWPLRLSQSSGLSPWARGILSAAFGRITETRSIPVGTGNPQQSCTAWPARRVYPRGHGESVMPSTCTALSSGLSPWARGIRAGVPARGTQGGSIPVGTGNPVYFR